jgi:hypothetical protein
MENRIKVGTVVWHICPTELFRGPGTVTGLFREFDVDFATVFWQGSLVTFDHRLTSLMTLAEKEGAHGNT